MGRKRQISPTRVAQMVILRKEGFKLHDIATRFGVSHTTVIRSISRFDSTGSFCARKRSGRKRVTSSQTDRLMRRAVVKDPTISSTDLANKLPADVKVSSRTIRRRLQCDFALRSYRPARVPKLSKKNIRDRLIFAKKYQHWTPQRWRSVMFSDESLLKQFYPFSTTVRRPVGKRYDPQYTIPRVKQSPSVMIWGTISASGRGSLWFMPPGTTINSKVYLDILKEKLTPFMSIRNCNIFQHDGAPCHQGRTVKKWLADNNIDVLGPWPGSSPDLNPIENCWAILKAKVAQLKPTSTRDLVDKIRLVWTTEISQDFCSKLIESMPSRLEAVLKAKGGPTKY